MHRSTEPGTSPPAMAWLAALQRPQLTLAWSLDEWSRVIRLARRLRLLGRLAEAMDSGGVLAQLPAPVVRHLVAERQYGRWRTGLLQWALDRIGAQLKDAAYPKVLLKGAAYIGQDLSIAAGRLPSDIDILVPKQHLADAQRRLQLAGWSEEDMDEHDRIYYHEWSHEVPPMRHPLQALELDLHHNILPPVAHTRVDASLLLARLQPSRWPGWQVFHPQDQVLHSAAHLFHDSETRDRLRDLVDLDGLLRHFGSTPGFWDGLPDRAAQLGLTEPLALACHFAQQWFQTPVPAAVHQRIQAQGPSTLRRAWLHPLMATLLTPTEPDHAPAWRQGLAAQVLLVRYHYRRMPLRILLPHLWHKAHTRRLSVEERTTRSDSKDPA